MKSLHRKKTSIKAGPFSSWIRERVLDVSDAYPQEVNRKETPAVEKLPSFREWRKRKLASRF